MWQGVTALSKHGSSNVAKIKIMSDQSLTVVPVQRCTFVGHHAALTSNCCSAWQALLLIILIIIAKQEHRLVILQHMS